ncbi:MAG: serine/threonine protein kinase [Ilumatobacteraceae bacterium]|nr:serine/threonine protein kinase [Ilumatobacteraceae bacterium]
MRRRLGLGGMSEVWAARDGRLDRDVAVKISVRDGRSAGRPSLLEEARAASKVRHRNVVTVFDCGRTKSIEYLVMEITDGQTVRSRLSDGPLPLADLRRLGTDLLVALDAVHHAGLAHRDVKPSNILRTTVGRWKLADFGAAAPIAPVYGIGELERSVLGTPGYLAPERRAGRPASVASDLYAAAVALHEAALGCRPVPSTELPTQPVPVASVVHVGAASPARIARMAFVDALRPALAADPTMRPASARKLAEGLEEAVRSAYRCQSTMSSRPARRSHLAAALSLAR